MPSMLSTRNTFFVRLSLNNLEERKRFMSISLPLVKSPRLVLRAEGMYEGGFLVRGGSLDPQRDSCKEQTEADMDWRSSPVQGIQDQACDTVSKGKRNANKYKYIK